jgi:hypothetical protein
LTPFAPETQHRTGLNSLNIFRFCHHGISLSCSAHPSHIIAHRSPRRETGSPLAAVL